MKHFVYLLLLTLAVAAEYGCQQSANSTPKTTMTNTEGGVGTQKFNDYWYQGKAEVASYILRQSRYGEVREGDAALVFVTEGFSKNKQVKLDYPGRAGNDQISVMKMNFTKKFNTGIYPYSVMLSVFTPVQRKQFPNTLKAAMSAQEWCGQVYTQLNLDKNMYKVRGYSYFEQEGDVDNQISQVFLEDELWTVARLDYKLLPTGRFEAMPGLMHTRLNHQALAPIQAEASLEDTKSQVVYRLHYPIANRSLVVEIEKSFPHKILGWEETFQSRGQQRVTKAVLDKTLWIDYWNKNSNQDAYLRDTLRLEY